MHFELNLPQPPSSRLYISALVMGLSYFLGGLIPMIPYFAIQNVSRALLVSIGITVVTLLSFGYTKAIATGTTRKEAGWSAVQTLVVGVLAAAASYGIVRGVNSICSVNM